MGQPWRPLLSLEPITAQDRSLSWFKRTVRLQVSLANRGNQPLHCRLEGSDRQELCDFTFFLPDASTRYSEYLELRLPAGEIVPVTIHIKALAPRWISLWPRVHYCTLSITNHTYDQIRQSQLIRLHDWPLLHGGFLVALAIFLLYWFGSSLFQADFWSLLADETTNLLPDSLMQRDQLQLITWQFSEPTEEERPSLWSVRPTGQAEDAVIAAQGTAEAPSNCPLPELQAYQHLSASGSYTVTQTEAADPMVCRIERESCSYQYLVGNRDPTIIFKNEEAFPFNHEDFLMHPAMLLPLNRLNELVFQEWGGQVQLRVTDAYDSLLEHDLNQPDETKKNSLHFEGKAIDLTTWPIDQTRYGRLCVLAHCAGFDWVHNEVTHCHAAIKAESLCLRCRN